MVTPGFTPPNTRTALRCWKRLSVRGAVLVSMRVNVDTGTSSPPGVLILRSSSGPSVARSVVADLRDDLVAAVEEVEAVDVLRRRAACRAPPDAGEVEPEVGDPLAVDHDARLGQVDLQVGVDVQELAALPAGADHRRRRSRASAPAARRSAAPARRRTGPASAAADRAAGTRAGRAPATPRRTPRRTSARSSARARFQSFATMPPKPPQFAVSDHMNSVSGNDLTRLDHLRGDRGWSRASDASGDGLEEQADVALVLDRRELLPRERVQRPRRAP